MPKHVSRESLINKLREMGFKHCGESERVQMYRHSSGLRVQVRKRNLIDASEARSILRQAQCGADEIASFLNCAN